MHESQLRVEASKEKRLQRSTSASSGIAPTQVRREDVLEEQTFRAMLALERRRAERSRQPFVLLLLDSSALGREWYAATAQRLAFVISGAVRESDLIGWYQGDRVLAVIFTEISANEIGSIAKVLSAKILKTVRENLDPKVASKLIISAHLFPENWDGDRCDRPADLKLYPDLNAAPKKQRFRMIVKRGIDIVGSAALMLILAPVLLVIAVAIKLTSKGPVIFRQERLGQFGNSFECLKFRTMFADNDPKIHREYVKSFIGGNAEENKCSETGANVYKIKNDPRITPAGRWLRRTSLDELPQFLNVLLGEMSLVGPRPSLLYEFEGYDFWHRRRVLEVKPGVTGLWQVMGRSRTSFDDMVRMDLRYCQRWSLWLDLKILLATPFAVFIGHGAY